MNNPLIVEGIDCSNLLKAFEKFEAFRKDLSSEINRTAAIQAFTFTYELAWKTLKRILENRSQVLNSPRDVLRAAAQANLIDQPEVWFAFIKMRNLTVHTYDENAANEIIHGFDDFGFHIRILVNRLERLRDDASTQT